MKSVPAAEAGIIFSTEPIWATGFASLLLGEALQGGQLAGAGLILAGCVLSVIKGEGGHGPAPSSSSSEEDEMAVAAAAAAAAAAATEETPFSH